MSHDLVLRQDASELQITSANLWTFSINITYPLRMSFPLLDPNELCHYRFTFIVLLANWSISSSSSNSSFSPAFVIYILNVRLL
jgi:hypothetical protein